MLGNVANTLAGVFGSNDDAASRRNSAVPLSPTYTPSQIDSIFEHMTAPLQKVDAKKIVPPDGSISFADKDSRKAYDEYVKFLNKDPQKYASELATLERLRHSDIKYVIKVGGKQYSETAEGNTTTDGQKVFINIRNIGGPQGEKFDRNSRFAHELEHARQFDAGEFSFTKLPDGTWTPFFRNYDIMDEVRAFNAQLRVAPPIKDTPLLKSLRAAKSDDDRAEILFRAYPKLDDGRGKNNVVVFGESKGYKVGEVVRDGVSFGRVARVVK